MAMVSHYTVAKLTPDDRPWLVQVQHLLNEYAQQGWELVTACQFEGEGPQPEDQTIRSLSNVTNTLFIFKRLI